MRGRKGLADGKPFSPPQNDYHSLNQPVFSFFWNNLFFGSPFRKIAYSAIQHILEKDLSFSKMIGESIDFFELEEFRVDLDKINQFIHEIKSLNYLEYNHVESHQEYQVGIKSTEKLEKLAEEIRNNPLPKDWTSWDESTKTDGVLVVVTDNLEKRTILHESGVWRGFASNVKEPEKKTQTSDTTENSTTEKEKPPITSTAKKPPINYPQKWRIQVVILLIIAATITTLIFLSIQYLVEPQQMLQPQIQKQQILQPQPQPTKTPQNQSPQKKTLETPAQKVIKPQPI